jgi:cardiolipin synthase
VTIHLLSGYTNIVAFRPILDLIDQAVESIVVESPYVTFPFWGRLKRARRRGLKVVVIIPSSNNRRFMTPYMVWEATRAGIEVWFCPKMTHLKGMLLDGKTMVMGSINFNVLGYLMNQEVVAVITDRDTVATFRDRVIAEDLRRSVKHK